MSRSQRRPRHKIPKFLERTCFEDVPSQVRAFGLTYHFVSGRVHPVDPEVIIARYERK